MKLQVRFALLMAAIFAALAGLLFAQRYFDIQRSQKVLTSSLDQRKQLFNVSLEAEGSTFKSFSEDYSFWDDMVDFVATGNQEFATTNIDSGLQTFQADADWVFDPDGNQVYMSKADPATDVSGVMFNRSFFEAVSTNKFVHYYVQLPSGIFEIRAATIVPGDDPDHSTPPSGYWIIGRFLDDSFITNLTALSQSNVKFVGATDTNTGTINHDSVSFNMPLRDLAGQTVGQLQSSATISLVNDLNSLYKREVFFLAIIGIVIMAIILFTIWWAVLRPLNLIIRSITTQMPTLLTSLAASGSQFGNLAKIVQEFFNQKLIIQQDSFQKDELERLGQEKTAFLAVAAHELKAPSAIIKLVAEDLPRVIAAHPEMQIITKQLDIISHQAVKMTTMISDMRLASEGKENEDYKIIALELDSFVQAEVTELGYVINQPIVFRGTSAAEVMADSERLSQVISNLIRNAAKYSPADKEILVTTYQKDVEAIIKIEDFGVGINPSDQEHIFERFYRAPSVTHTHQGLGLGLSICKTIIDRLGGRVWVDSQPGSGSRFYIALPVSVPVQQPTTSDNEQPFLS